MPCNAERTGSVPVLVIFAPTACGKTSLALELFGQDSSSPLAGLAEIVSADSMQVYRGMDIGTAKPGPAITGQLPHHLIDIHTPNVPFSAGEFVRLGDEACREIYLRGKLPVVLGGTGFYIRNFLCGLPQTPQSDPSVRAFLQDRLRREGGEVLYQELLQCDPVAASTIHRNDVYRILRALEVFMSCGQPRSSFSLSPRLRGQYDFCVMVLWRERQELYYRIEQRVQDMMEDGLVGEVQALQAAGYSRSDPGMSAIGYREFFDSGWDSMPRSGDLNEIQEAICRNSRRYAKRQYTYFKGIPGAHYFHAADKAGIYNHILDFVGMQDGLSPALPCMR